MALDLSKEGDLSHLSPTALMRCLGSWEWDVQTGAVRMASSLERIFGAEILSRVDFLGHIHPDDRERVQETLARVERHLGSCEIECRVLLADGSTRWHYYTAESIGSDGMVERIIGTATDLTEWRRQSQDTRAREQRWRLAIEETLDGIWDWNLITNEPHYSAKWTQILGPLPDEVLRRNEGLETIVHPEDIETFRRQICDIKCGIATEFEIRVRLRSREGGHRWLNMNGAAIRDENGHVVRMIGSITDVTATVRYEEQVRRSQQILTAVCDASESQLFLLGAERNQNGRIVDFVFLDVNTSAERALGLSRSRILGKRISDLAPASRRDGSFEKYQRCIETEQRLDEDIVLAEGGLHAVHLHQSILPVSEGVAVITTDVTEQRRAASALQHSERLIKRIAASIPDHLFLWDVEAEHTIFRNRSFLADLGYRTDHADLTEHDVFDKLLHPEDVAELRGFLESIREAVDDETREINLRIRAASGEYRVVGLRMSVFQRDADGAASQLLGVAQDVTDQRAYQRLLENQMQRLNETQVLLEARQAELEQLNARLGALAVTDGLTGLKNHRAFQERLAEEIDRARRYGHPLALALADVDHFKQFNDAHGHPAGDAMLKAFAQVLVESTRLSDIVVRYGGEEFAVILPDTTGREAARMAERVQKGLRNLSVHGETVTASFGCAELIPGGEGKSQIVGDADRALYRSKHAGRDRITVAGMDVPEVTSHAVVDPL